MMYICGFFRKIIKENTMDIRKFLGAAVVMLAFVACDSDNKGDKPLSPEDQKVEMEAIASELMTEFAATEFEDVMKTISDLYLSCEETFSGDYDWSALEDAYEEKLRAVMSYDEIDEYTELQTIKLLLSTFNGEITLGEGAASFKPADKAVVIYTDDNGIKWTAELSTEGAVKEVYLGKFVTRSESVGYIDEYGNYVYGESYETHSKITVGVPEKLIVSLKKNAENYLTSTTTFNVSISSTGIDPEKDRISITEVFEAQGIKVVLDKCLCDAAAGNLEQSMAVYKDGKFICSGKASMNGKVDFESEEWSANNINVSIDLLGKMQIKGSCPDAKSINSIMENADPQSEKDWDRIVNNLNTKYNLNVYFNGGSTSQAIMNLEARYEDDSYGPYYWTEPAIEFNDGSRYLLYEYFTEDNFSDTIEGAESFVEKYERLLERYFDFIF